MSFAIILLLGLAIGAMAAIADAVSSGAARRAAIESRMQLISVGGEMPGHGRSGTAGPILGSAKDIIQRLFALGVSRRWGVKLPALTLTSAALLAGALAWLLLHDLAKWPGWLCLWVSAAAVAVTPRTMLRLEQRATEARFLEAFPDAIDMVVRTLRAGVPITAAIRAVASDAAPPVSTVFAALADQAEIGVPLDEALSGAAKWIRLPDFRFFAVAVALQYATGGNLVATLESLSDMVRRRRVTRLKVKAVSAEVRLSTYILSALPFLVVAALLFVTPDYLKPLISDRRGNWILGLAVGSLLSGLFVMRRMMRSVSSD
jgi:tight adherence protein B